MEYAEKATWWLYGVDNVKTICHNCSYPPNFVADRTSACCERCPFLMMIWLFNEEQIQVWIELRPKEMQRKEIEKAVAEGHEIAPQIKEIIGRVPETVALPLFLVKIM